MRYLILFYVILLSIPCMAQIPKDGDYSNWNWENQDQNNWQRELSAGEPDNDGINDGWANIKPPFLSTSVRVGEIVDVYETKDYTKEKGWGLIWANFNSIYPYFILYNRHKSIVRAFFYLDGSDTYSHILGNLSFHDSNNPGILAGGDDGSWATDKYINGEQNGKNDQLSVIIPNVGLQSWCSADFPIMFDNNIEHSKYDNKKWVFLFYGVDNYSITLSGTGVTAPNDLQHSISGGNVSSGQFSVKHGKFHKQLKTTSELLDQMKASTKNIDNTSAKFLQNYKSTVSNLNNVAQLFNAAVGISAGAGAVLGFFNLITGSFDDKNSTKPQAVTQYLNIEGTMDIKKTLGGTTIKIPGVKGPMFPPVAWNPYNCSVGSINLKKTPTVKVTKIYGRYGCIDNQYKPTRPRYIEGYEGNYRKYKFDEDVELVLNELDGMNLIDIHFAIVCKSTGTGKRGYSVEDRFIAGYEHSNILGQTVTRNVINPVYEELDSGRFIIHKFDKEAKEVVFGTPYIKMNDFKGITFELPEDTDVKIRMLAKFSSKYYEKPVIFQTDYRFDIIEEKPNKGKLFCNDEQSNFLYSDYYKDIESFKSLGPGTYSSTYTAKDIELKSGFIGTSGFIANAMDIYPSNGNTIIQNMNFNCSNDPSSGRIGNFADMKIEMTEQKSDKISEKVKVFPNPSSGHFYIKSNKDYPLKYIKVYDLDGKVVCNKPVDSTESEFEISNYPPGMYILKLIYENNVRVYKIVKQ